MIRARAASSEVEVMPAGIRLYFWACVVSTIVFLLLEYWAITLQFPRGQFPPIPGLYICVAMGVLSAVSLGIGFWKFRRRAVTQSVWIVGILLGGIVGIQFVLSVVGLVQMFLKLTR
jgi:hypothetical protein